MSDMHLLTFNEEAFALAMAKRMAELGYCVLWEPKEPTLVHYRQPSVGRFPAVSALKTEVKPAERWWDHGRIDTR